MPGTDPTAAIEAAFRIEFPRLVAGLTRFVGDVGLAEELAQDTLVDALVQWPSEGTPRNPGAWLMTVGKRKAIDRFRRDRNLDGKYAELGRDGTSPDPRSAAPPGTRGVFEDHIDDDVLRLMFVACHPILSVRVRTTLTLRLVGGLTTAEIARAYLEPEPTVAQRIVRAKRTISRAGIPFEVPEGEDRATRLGSVLEVVYVMFNEGYSATAGTDWMRPALCAEALRLGRVLCELAPDEPEVHGLTALMEVQSSRLRSRRGPDGEPVLLLDQDRRTWDRLLINRGLAALDRSRVLGSARGPYTLQAAVAACHAVAFRAEDTDWPRVVALYGELAEVSPSPIVELNRAVAVSMAFGPAAGLDLVDQLCETGTLDGYHLLHGVRGDFLDKLDRHDEAADAFTRAASLTQNASERQLLLARAQAQPHANPSSVPPER
ncbi:MAG: RNA polymerase sigma factor [Acidimicrobiales bacterium]